MSSLTRWSPWGEMSRIHRDMDRMFGAFLGDWPTVSEYAWVPATEAVSDENGWTLRMALPGVAPKDVQVDVDGRTLTVSGERHLGDEDSERQISEIGYGRFERRFTLPASVATDEVTATFENGMLMLKLPVAESAKPRRIEVSGDVSGAKKVA